MSDEIVEPTVPDQPADPPPMPKATREDRLRRQLIGPFTVGQVIGVVGSIVLSALVLIVLTSPLSVPPSASPPRPGASFVAVGPQVEGLRIGDLAPEFTGTTPSGETVGLVDLQGNPIRLADMRGHPVWINFWATWCPPCQEETPILREMQAKYGAMGLELVAISVQETTADDVRAYVDRYQLRYTVGFDATSAIFHTYHAFGLPTQLFLDSGGVIRNVVLGPITRAEADEIITGLLPSTSGSPAPTGSPARTAAPTAAPGQRPS
jgi:cytochrome c biogenesis protein CcmG/thiol:disulfide interchange protein DsbE